MTTFVTIQFKNSDIAFELARKQYPRSESLREAFLDKYFEHCDYGRIEINTATLETRLLPVDEWK